MSSVPGFWPALSWISPVCSQMAFAVEDDLRTLIIVTPRKTTKFDDILSSNPNVSFLVSTAKNDPADPGSAQSLTVTALPRSSTESGGARPCPCSRAGIRT